MESEDYRRPIDLLEFPDGFEHRTVGEWERLIYFNYTHIHIYAR